MFLLTGGGVLLVVGSVNFLSNGGVKFDFDLCIFGLPDLCPRDRFPVEVADFNFLTS